MSSGGISGNSSKPDKPSPQRTSSNNSARRSSSAAKPSKPNKPQSNNTARRPDQVNVTKEKEKAGATPDFGASFGSNPMKKGAQGENVKQIQEMLNSKGAKLDVDGKFGAKTLDAVKAFQDKEHLKKDGVIGKDTIGKLQGSDQPAKPEEAAKDPAAKPETAAKPEAAVQTDPNAKPGATNGNISLPPGYGGLEKLSGELNKNDPRFNTNTPEGRSATALALAIGGTEQFGKDTKATNFYTAMGGTNNKMKGFAQYNTAYHASKINTPEKYTKFLGDQLTGKGVMPNGKSGGNHVAALTEAVKSGKIKTGDDLRNFMKQHKFGGSNWQGIDDGWKRNPGLANALVGMLNQK